MKRPQVGPERPKGYDPEAAAESTGFMKPQVQDLAAPRGPGLMRPQGQWTVVAANTPDITLLDPRGLIGWINQQSRFKLSGCDERAIENYKISGSVFLNFGAKDFLLTAGVSRKSINILELYRRHIIRVNKKSNTTEHTPSSKSHAYVPAGNYEAIGINDIQKESGRDSDCMPGSWPDESNSKTLKKAQGIHTQVMHKFALHFSSIADAEEKLSSPTFYIRFPFPYAGVVLSPQFKYEEEAVQGLFTYGYMGREVFTNVLDSFLGILNNPSVAELWVHGPTGLGKSHLLATAACILTAGGYRVIYLPDCRALQVAPFRYVRTAMYFAWADDPERTAQISSLRSEEDIQSFLISAGDSVVFIIDEINALDGPDDTHGSSRAGIRAWLTACRSQSRTILSTSVINTSCLTPRHQQNNEKVLYLHGGLTENEMTAWWKRHSDVKSDGYSRDQIEDCTGRIPLLLDGSIIDGRVDLSSPEINKVVRRAKNLAVRMINASDDEEWTRYQRYIRSCVLKQWVDGDLPDEIIDNGLFYDIDGIGQCVCGAARNAVIKKFSQLGQEVFTPAYILQGVHRFINDPPLLAFFLGRAVMPTIAVAGLSFLDPDMRGPMLQMTFEHFPKYDIEQEQALYIPAAYNHPAIDALVLRLDQEKKTAHILPIQIAIAQPHRDSEKQFFAHWFSWIEGLWDYDIKVTFLRITAAERTEQYMVNTVEEKYEVHCGEPHSRDLINPHYQVMDIPLENLNWDVWNHYKKAKDDSFELLV